MKACPGWFMFQLNLCGRPDPGLPPASHLPGRALWIPAQILRPWRPDGEPIILEERLTLGAELL